MSTSTLITELDESGAAPLAMPYPRAFDGDEGDEGDEGGAKPSEAAPRRKRGRPRKGEERPPGPRIRKVRKKKKKTTTRKKKKKATKRPGNTAMRAGQVLRDRKVPQPADFLEKVEIVVPDLPEPELMPEQRKDQVVEVGYRLLKQKGHVTRVEARHVSAHFGFSERTVWRYINEARLRYMTEQMDVTPSDAHASRVAQLIRYSHSLPRLEQLLDAALAANEAIEAEKYDRMLMRRLGKRDELCGLSHFSPLHDLNVAAVRGVVVTELERQADVFTVEELERLATVVAGALERKRKSDAEAAASGADADLDTVLP